MIHRLRAEGISIAEIARRLGRSRQTIYNRLRCDSESAESARSPEISTSKERRLKPTDESVQSSSVFLSKMESVLTEDSDHTLNQTSERKGTVA